MAYRHSSSAAYSAVLLLLLVLTSSTSSPTGAEARPLTPSPTDQQPRYLKVLATLGIACECCDGPASACRSISNDYSTCKVAQLKCRPWKFA